MKRINVNLNSLIIKILILTCLFLCIPFSVKAQTKLIGHRGYSGRYTENTIESMEMAYESGFDGVEMDLRECKNHTLLIFHSKRLKRMTGKKGTIYKVKYSTRSRYTLKNGTIIPTLDEVLQRLQGKTDIFIHIKGSRYGTLSKKAQRKIVSTVKKYNLEDQVYLFADRKTMNKLHFGKIKTGWLTTAKNPGKLRRTIREAKRKKVDLVLLLNKSQFTAKGNGAKLVKYAHKRGIKIGLYFTNTKAAYDYLTNINADYGIANYYFK